MERLPDNCYIERIRKGETNCFAHLLECYGKQIFSLIARIVENREDAEELTQDVFLKVFRNIESFRGESSFSTWLYRIAYNTAVSATRKKAIELSAIDETMIENIPDETEDEFRNEEIAARVGYLNIALEKLLPEERAMIMMFYKNGRSMEEIAEITGLTETNVKTKIFRIRKKLFVLIKKMENDKI